MPGVVVCGAMGRMGRAILGILKEGPNRFSLSGAVEAVGHPLLCLLYTSPSPRDS